jgi:hypothetical protein
MHAICVRQSHEFGLRQSHAQVRGLEQERRGGAGLARALHIERTQPGQVLAPTGATSLSVTLSL